jgi:hypothetical protein
MIDRDFYDDEDYDIDLNADGLEHEDDSEFDDDILDDIDFSDFKGKDFKSSFAKVNKHIDKKQAVKQNKKGGFVRKKKPLTKDFGIKKGATITGGKKKISKIIVPRDKKVIVEGVSKFILSKDVKDDAVRNIGYYKGKKLKEMVLIFNNHTPNDLTLQLFNPSMPLDYLYSTSQNLNNQIQVAGGAVAYSDVLFNLLANPTLVVNAKFILTGPAFNSQIAIPLQYINKEITGTVDITPINLALQIDNMQVFDYVVNYDLMGTLNRPFIPDGMDVINYKVLAGMTVTMCFYYKQVSLKKFFFEEARNSKKLM